MRFGHTPVRPLVVDLGPGPAPTELVRRAADRDGLVALIGEWADGTAVLSSHPTRESASPDALAEQPEVAGAPPGFLGGGWFGRVPFDGPCALAFHDHVVRYVDGRWRFEALVADGDDRLGVRQEEWASLLAAPTPHSSWEVGDFTGRDRDEHLAAVEGAIELIRAGELYQVNVCTRLTAPFRGDPAALFADAVDELAPSHAALHTGSPAVVSLSPESFLRRRGRHVDTSPIKGTRPRAVPGNDAVLRRSVKDVAENVMIVDLVRNDLGRVGEIGSVRPSGLLDVRPAPGVWHLVSTVEGELRPDVTDADLFAATFPPGSVTGAPKLRAIDAIRALEPVPRATFTGAVGFAAATLGAEFSVAIRTFEIADGRIELGVGGGITADSVPVLEWEECLDKAAPLVGAARSRLAPHLARHPRGDREGGVLETVLVLDGVAVRLADHLARLDRSLRELTGHGIDGDLPEHATAVAAAAPGGATVLRIVVDRNGTAELTSRPLEGTVGPSRLRCAVREPGSWRHKWADRSWANPDTLYVAADGAVLETERGNVFLVEPDGTLVTPPLRDDVLPGVTRRAVLDLARDAGRPTRLRTFDLATLVRRPAFWTSSLRGAVPIESIDGTALPRADDLVAAIAAALLGGENRVR